VDHEQSSPVVAGRAVPRARRRPLGPALAPPAGRLGAAALGGLLTAYAAVAAGVGDAEVARFFDTWVYCALLLAAAALILARARASARARAAWLALGAAPAVWVGGEIVWNTWLADDEAPPYPSAADALWLASYVLAAAGIGLLIGALLRGRGRAVWLDAAIGAAALGAVVAQALLGPVLDQDGGGWLADATDLAFPLGDLALVTLAVTIVALTGWRPARPWIAVAAALCVQGIADAVAARDVALASEPPPAILGAAWPAAWLLIALAAWRPLRAAPREALPRVRTIVLPVVLALVALGILAAGRLGEVNDLAAWLAVVAVGLAVARLAVAQRHNLALLDRAHHDAVTDALTGLPNRRAFLADLEALLEEGAPVALALFDLDGFKAYNDEYGHPAGDALLTRLGTKLEDAVGADGHVYRLGGDEFCLLVGAHLRERAVAAADGALAERGEGFAITCSRGVVELPAECGDTSGALGLADRRLYSAKARRPVSATRQSRDVLLEVLAQREPDLHEHSEGVTALALRVAVRLGLGPEAQEDVARAAELHDIGKMAIPDAILNKPGPLDDEEWAFMRRHTVIGEEILAVAPSLEGVARLVRASHERWDGRGYPDGAAGEAIPLGARIVAVCDAYSAMVQDRPYQAGLSPRDALEEIERSAGHHFDPAVVSVFSAEMQGAGVR
jgi:diguanylate cyclase (GGDEF)-like protein